MNWQLTTFLVCYAAVALLAFRALGKTSCRVHSTLQALRAEALAAVTVAELEDVKAKLITFARRECTIRQFGAHAREVMAYINGRCRELALSHDDSVRQTMCHAACLAAADGARLEDIIEEYRSPAVIAICRLYAASS